VRQLFTKLDQELTLLRDQLQSLETSLVGLRTAQDKGIEGASRLREELIPLTDKLSISLSRVEALQVELTESLRRLPVERSAGGKTDIGTTTDIETTSESRKKEDVGG